MKDLKNYYRQKEALPIWRCQENRKEMETKSTIWKFFFLHDTEKVFTKK